MSRSTGACRDFRFRRRALLVCLSLACAFTNTGIAPAAGPARDRGAKEARSSETVLTVTNPLGIQRAEEVVSLPLAAIKARTGLGDPQRLRVKDLNTQNELITQLEATVEGQPPDQLLVLVNVGAHGRVQLAFHSGDRTAPVPLVFGRAVPERKDDFAWENDEVAYRVYGPALEASGEVSSGIDVWSKRTPRLIINDWYKRDAEGQRTRNPALSYHRDNGDGLDSYEVGPSRGCGGTGVWVDGKLYVSRNYTSVEVLESGPLRIRFRLKYAPWQAADLTVTEEKTVTLDAGSHLNKIESTFHFDGTKSAQIALGMGLHSGSLPVSVPGDGGGIALWESLTDPAAGMDGTALLLPAGKASIQTNANGNRLLVVSAASGVPVTYFAGAAWSKSDVPSAEAWAAYLRDYELRLGHPLQSRWTTVRDR